MLRSTVPVGTTRNIICSILEETSGLRAGADFSLVFAPERTVQGDALRELRELPQVVGGLTANCASRAINFWSSLSPSVVSAESLEAAELIKLSNNAFRDHSFAFSNELALLASQYNINAFRLIESANSGYPRNKMPIPGPGVGGYCLTKDPLLYGLTSRDQISTSALSILGRDINVEAGLYPVKVVRSFAEKLNNPLDTLNILIIGVAFKGEPETNDTRGSSSLEVAHALQKENVSVRGWDAILSDETIANVGIEPAGDLAGAVQKADAVLILNNHRKNIQPGLFIQGDSKNPKLIFDGWNQLDPEEIERVPGLVYATMGYVSDIK
jgi:UDP-N-acetyl-D-mannosaminuronic acid dehydrogenase